MKKTITKEIESCDFCDSDQEAYHECTNCGKNACYTCNEHNKLRMLKHAVNFSGSMDGAYCQDCYSELYESGSDELFNAYLELEKLTNEYQAFYGPWKAKANSAEKNIEFIWNNRKSTAL